MSRLKKLYLFRILFENCTTEILKSAQNSFEQNEISFSRKKINFNFPLSFIPFYASYSVSNSWDNEGEN